MYLQHPQKVPHKSKCKMLFKQDIDLCEIFPSKSVSWSCNICMLRLRGVEKQYFCGINYAINNFYCYYLAHNKNVEVGFEGKKLISIEIDASTCQNSNLSFFYSNYNRSQSTLLLKWNKLSTQLVANFIIIAL